MRSARDVIDDIRKNEFCIGNPDPSIGNLRAKLQRALQQLSEEIYSEGIHFVLELVQNAEDNEYAGAIPKLRFVVSQTQLHVLNNETGFGEASVRAICDVSRSTKTKTKGHIGEKGIGFKSVFRVTNEPRIFSNGYQFRLPKHDQETGLGYVIPFWVEDVPLQVVAGETNIFLPLKPDTQGELAKVVDIDPSLLLFLKKLRRVEVVDEVRDRTTEISRGGSDERVELRSAKGIDFWKIVRRTIPVQPGFHEEKRKDITETELALALQMTEGGDAKGEDFHPVHAYLPITDYGLRFAFHADFVLAAGREGILTDRSWNKWLRDSLTCLFLVAVEECKQDERLRTSVLAYVPRPEDEIDSFFKPATAAIREALRKVPCVLTASGSWVTPSAALIADDAIRTLVSNVDAIRLLGKEFIAPEFRADTKLLCCLGTTEFTINDLFKCLRAEEWVSERSDEWFCRLFAYLSTQDIDSWLDELKELAIVPLEGNGRTSTAVAKGGVFFPPNRRRKYGFESGLMVVRGSVLIAPEKGRTEAVTRFLRQLDVKKASPADLIREHMLPLFEGEEWKSRGDEFRHGCLEYIKDHWEECRKSPGLVSKLNASLWIRIDGSENQYAHPNWMYLSNAYGNTNPLKTLFRNIENIWFVDTVYLESEVERLRDRKARAKRGKVTRAERKKLKDTWRQFFVELGVETNIRIASTPASDKPGEANSPDLKKVIETGEVERITLALTLLDVEWDRYARWTKTKMVQQRRGYLRDLGTVKTTFGTLLTDSACIPVEGGGLAKPEDVFIDQPAVRELLAVSVVYLAIPIANEDFIKALGIHRDPSVAAALTYLRHLAHSRCSDQAAFERLYTFLQDNYNANASAIDAAFWTEALICIPTLPPRLLCADQVFWKDVSHLFGDSRGYLDKFYPQHKRFFRTQIEILESPEPEDFANRLRELAEAESIDSAREKVVWAVYRELDRVLREKEDRVEILSSNWWKEFIDQPVFLTEARTFAKRDVVVANDHDEYATLFRGRTGVALFIASTNRLPQVRHFLRATGIRSLSQAVKQEPVIPERAEPSEALTAQLRLLTPFLLRYLHHREADIYDRLKAEGKLGRLEAMLALTCEHPRARLILGSVNVEVERAAVVTQDTLYVRADAVDDLDAMGIALAIWLGNPKGLEDFLVTLLEKRETEKVRRFLARKGIPELPAEETEGVGEAVRSAEFEGSGATSEIGSPVEERASLVRVASEHCESQGESEPSQPENSSANQVDCLVPNANIPPERGGLPAQSGGFGARERQRTGSRPVPEPFSPHSEAHRLPFSATEKQPLVDWEQCPIEDAQVSWTLHETAHARGSRLHPAPDIPSTSGEKGADDLTDGRPDDLPDVRSAIGRWGEEYAVRCLRGELLANYPGATTEETECGFRLLLGTGPVAEVIWLNRHGEQGVGYDIEVIDGDSRLFVEVKATRDDARASFDLSQAQWEKAKTEGDSYRITRVYNAGRRDARAVHIRNPYQAWQEGALNVRSLRIVL